MDDSKEQKAAEAPAEVATSVAEAPKIDLEKERDERVAPVAQGIIEDIAGSDASLDIADKSQFTNTIIKVLKRSLAADLNVITDTPYAFQLVLGAFGAFNQTVLGAKMAEMQDVRFARIANEMMLLFAGAKVPMGTDVKTADQIASLESIKPQLEEIFAREMLTKLEVTYILEGLMNALKVTEQVYSQNIQDSTQRMEAKILQINDMSDLTMKKLDWALSTNIEEILAKDVPAKMQNTD